MKIQIKHFIPLAFLLAAGCLPVSIEPLYTDKDLILDPAIVGKWANPEDKEAWLFESAEGKAYGLSHTDGEGRVAQFKAHLLSLKGTRFLDIYPEDLGSELNWLAACNLVPGHVFFKIEVSEDELRLVPMQLEWLDNYLKAHPKAIAHKDLGQDDGRILITASTAALQKFVLKHAGNPEAFDSDNGLVLKKNPVQ